MWNYVTDIQGGFILYAECRKTKGGYEGMKLYLQTTRAQGTLVKMCINSAEDVKDFRLYSVIKK